MTVVTKVIKGHEYYYYQDTTFTPILKTANPNNNNDKQKQKVTTLIGRTDLDDRELLKRREEALEKHFAKILKASSVIEKVKYKFENKPTQTNADIYTLEMTKIVYKQYMNYLLPQEREDIQNEFFIKYVHGTTAIEGNTLTEDEAGKLLSMGLTSNNKSYNETVEVANYNDVRQFMKEYHGDVTEKLIKHINKLQVKGLIGLDGKPINAGEYRTSNAKITGMWYKPVSSELISKYLYYALADYHDGQKRNVHPVELASIFHQKFEEIHPFQDGNGRTGREILNYMLIRNGFPSIYITPKQRSEYLNALEEGNKSNYVPLIDFIVTRIKATLAYLTSRNSIFNIIKSDQYKKFFLQIGDESVYNKWVSQVENMIRSEELP